MIITWGVSGENFVGEAGGLFEEPPVPEVTMPPEADVNQQQKDAGEVMGNIPTIARESNLHKLFITFS